ncbi:MAG: response regulator [Cyanobacteria bacterium]|nr:response regulator [Cyanobacteriota bacterium]
MTTKILLAEADVDKSIEIFTCLEENGYVVELATDGKIAMNALDRTEYDATIVSKILPDLDGMEICKKYKAKGGKGPIIMLAELAGNELSTPLIGIDLLLDESTDAGQILSTVAELLKRQESGTRQEEGSDERFHFTREPDGATAVVVSRGLPVHVTGVRSARSGAAEQMEDALHKLVRLLKGFGGTISDIAQITVYVVDLERNARAVTAALHELTSEHAPCVTLLGVAALTEKASLLEVSATAYID